MMYKTSSYSDKRLEGCPALVISLDFELRWGVGGRVPGSEHPYWSNIVGAGNAAERLLTLFEERGVHATWATVGFLFAHSGADLEAFIPKVLPLYRHRDRNNYCLLQNGCEEEGGIRFAPDIVERIFRSEGQELASHSFSHYYCNELGQGPAAFEADLEAAQKIAGRIGAAPKSFVFPSNQVNPSYLPLLSEAGMLVYRGNPAVRYPLGSLAFPAIVEKVVSRSRRYLDQYWNLTGHNTIPWGDVVQEAPRNVRASRFLRPNPSKFSIPRALQIRRVVKGLEEAVRRKEIYHLWWHPHNFGKNIEENISALGLILDEFERLRLSHGMKSMTMLEAAQEAERLLAERELIGSPSQEG